MAVLVESLQQRLWLAKLEIHIDSLGLYGKSLPASKLERIPRGMWLVWREQGQVHEMAEVRGRGEHWASWAIARTLALTRCEVRKH